MAHLFDIDHFLSLKRPREGVAINCFAAAIALIVIYLGYIDIPNSDAEHQRFILIPKEYEMGVILWIVASLFFAARSLTRKAKITPDVVNPTCPFCGGTMGTSVLHCLNCGKPAGENKP